MGFDRDGGSYSNNYSYIGWRQCWRSYCGGSESRLNHCRWSWGYSYYGMRVTCQQSCYFLFSKFRFPGFCLFFLILQVVESDNLPDTWKCIKNHNGDQFVHEIGPSRTVKLPVENWGILVVPVVKSNE